MAEEPKPDSRISGPQSVPNDSEASANVDVRTALVLTETRDCPLCGCPDDLWVYAEAAIDPEKLDGFAFASRKLPEYMHHRLVRCAICDLVYATPIPRTPMLAKAYREADFDSGEESRYAARTASAYVRRHVYRKDWPGFGNSKKRALDIGAGDGAFLEELLDLGFTEVSGVEPSTAPIAAASARVRSRIRQALFDSADYEPESMDLVTCFQVIEHVPDPLDLVRGAFRLLRPGGAFLMISHNRDALSAKVLGTRSPIFDIEHLQLFSMDAARDMFGRAGLVDVRGFGVVNRYPLHYYLKLLPIPNGIKRPLLSAARGSSLGKVAIPAALGNLGVIGFRPK